MAQLVVEGSLTACCLEIPCPHAFQLRPLRSTLYHRQTVVSFCPVKTSNSNYNSWPQAFLDGKSHLPLFMLEADRGSFLKREKQYQEAHENKIRSYEDDSRDILVPHPGKSKHNCFVCKTHYTDYLKHITTKRHKKILNESKMESTIRDLVDSVWKDSGIKKEEVVTPCLPKGSRKTPVSTTPKLKKRHLKQQKFKQVSKQQNVFSDEDQLKVKTTRAGGSIPEENGLSPNSFINEIFRVSDYLL